MRQINVRNNNGSCCIRFTVPGLGSFSLTKGSYTNTLDVARMERIAQDIRESVLAGTFTGVDQYRAKDDIPTFTDVFKGLEESTSPHKGSLVKFLLPASESLFIQQVIQQLCDSSPLAATTKRRYIAELKTIFPEYKDYFTVKVKTGKKTVSKRDPFSKTEVNTICEAFQGSVYYSFTRMLFHTGMRVSECIALRKRNIDFDSGVIVIAESMTRKNKNNREVKGTKTGLTRKFPINPELKRFLLGLHCWSDIEAQGQLVFAEPDGEPFTDTGYRSAWEYRLNLSNVRYRPPYTARHTFISHCLQQGIDVATVAQWVGNSPETIWKHYAHCVGNTAVPSLWEDAKSIILMK